jgi:ABC-type multidrug transport system fused ATPase/permease subunit
MIKPINSSELKQLLTFAYPERKLLIWGTLFLVLGSLVLLAFPQAVRITMDEAVETKNLALINQMGMVMLLFLGIQSLATAFRGAKTKNCYRQSYVKESSHLNSR